MGVIELQDIEKQPNYIEQIHQNSLATEYIFQVNKNDSQNIMSLS